MPLNYNFSMRFIFGLFALASSVATAQICVSQFSWPQLPMSTKIVDEVKVNAPAQTFTNKQVWKVTGVSHEQLMWARKHVTFTGQYGVINMDFLTTDTAIEKQNTNGEVTACGARPCGLPSFVGSKAQTKLTDLGFKISMSEGPIGQGGSSVTIGETKLSEDGIPYVLVTEIGEYSVKAQAGGLFAPFSMLYNFALGSNPIGWSMSYTQLKIMGELHNKAFDGEGL